MKYFLVTYDRLVGVGEIRDVFPAECRSVAIRSRFTLEQQTNSDTEVVVLGAESEDDLRRTHSRYFKSAATLLNRADSLADA